MAQETLADRKYKFVQNATTKKVNCFISISGKTGTNPAGTLIKTSAPAGIDNFQVRCKVTTDESIVASGVTLADGKAKLIETLIANGALPVGAVELV